MEQDSKRDQIIDKAKLRFAHFGIQKTTMNEIAEDLSMSKPSMYYYFPDKTSLIISVIEKIVEEYQARLRELFLKSSTLKDSFFSMIELRNEFLRKYFMMHLTEHSDIALLKKEIRPVINNIRMNEVELVKMVFRKAMEQGNLKVADLDSISGLFIDSLAGLNLNVMAQHEKSLVPESEVFEEILRRQKQLTMIFICGIENHCVLDKNLK